jgi:hypothetical protein
LHKTSIQEVRLYDSSRNNIIDAEKIQESVDDIYQVFDNIEDIRIMQRKAARAKARTAINR